MIFRTGSLSRVFFFNDTATSEIYTLSLHDALPIFGDFGRCLVPGSAQGEILYTDVRLSFWMRSEEHTSELQSHVNLVCRLLLEKKKPHLHQHYGRGHFTHGADTLFAPHADSRFLPP